MNLVLRCSTLSAALSLLLFVCAPQAHGNELSRRDQRDFALSVCQVLLEIPDLSIPTLKKLGMVSEVAHRVFAFEGSPMHAHEMISLQRFAAVMGGSVLAAGGLLYMSGVPAVDAVFFPDGDTQPVNVSVKTSMADRENGMNFVKYKMRDAELSLDKHYSRAGMAGSLGLTLDDEGDFDGRGHAHRNYKVAMAQVLTRLLALENTSTRPAAVFLDLSTEKRQSPFFLTASESDFAGMDPETTKPEDILLRVLDLRVAEDEIERPLLVNLSKKMRRLEQTPHMDQYIILFHRSLVQVGRSGIIHRPVNPKIFRRQNRRLTSPAAGQSAPSTLSAPPTKET